MNNIQRARAARAALASYTRITYGGRSPETLGAPMIDKGLDGEVAEEDMDIQTAVADLICDLGHYCRAVGLDYGKQLSDAERHYQYEGGLGWDEED